MPIEVADVVVTREDTTTERAWHGLAFHSLLHQDAVGGRAGVVGVPAVHMVTEVGKRGEGEKAAVARVVALTPACDVVELVALRAGVRLGGGGMRRSVHAAGVGLGGAEHRVNGGVASSSEPERFLLTRVLYTLQWPCLSR